MDKFLEFLSDEAANFGLKALLALAVIIIGLKISKKISKLILRIRRLEDADAGVIHFLSSAVRIILYMMVFFSAAMIMGVPSATFITILGSIALAVGLAMQGSLSNLAGSVMILLFKPFKIGDYIEADGVSGTVKDINLFYTVITAFDGRTISCPNGALSNSNVINYTSNGRRRVEITFQVSYDSDIDTVKDILLGCAQSEDMVLSDPAPDAFLSAYGEDALIFTLLAWCGCDNFFAVKNSITENVKRAFDSRGVTIPYRQLDVHLTK